VSISLALFSAKYRSKKMYTAIIERSMIGSITHPPLITKLKNVSSLVPVEVISVVSEVMICSIVNIFMIKIMIFNEDIKKTRYRHS
jgi:hypothetical protein